MIDFLQSNGEGVQLRNVLIVDSNVKKYGLQICFMSMGNINPIVIQGLLMKEDLIDFI